MRLLRSIVMALWVVAAVGCASRMPASPLSPPQSASAEHEWEADLRREHKHRDALNEVVSVEYKAKPLADVLSDLKQRTPVPIHVNWDEMKARGVKENQPITLHLTEVPVRTVLRFVTMHVHDADLTAPLGFSVRPEGVVVSTRKDLDRTTDTRVYALDYLAGRMTAAEMLASLKVRAADTYMGRLHVDPAASDEEWDGRRAAQIERIVEAIQSLVGRQEHWAVNGGSVSSLRELNSNLIVKTRFEDHTDIEHLLDALNESQVHIAADYYRHREVLHRLQQADALRLRRRYDEALLEVRRALRVDPNHSLALAMQKVIADTIARRDAAGRE